MNSWININTQLDVLFDLFKKNGYELYLIGGYVRDSLLKLNSDDYDFCTNAHPAEMEKILKDFTIDTYQAKIGTVKIKFNEKIITITTYRIDLKYIGRYPIVKFVNKLKKDVKRRDFTINQIAYNKDRGIVDYLNGISDLKQKRLKFIGKPIKRIKEDPIRILRALRFSLKLDLKISDRTFAILNNNAYLLEDIKMIKYEELIKILDLMDSNSLRKYEVFLSKCFKDINFSKLVNVDAKYFSTIIWFLMPKEIATKVLNNISSKLVNKRLLLESLNFDYSDSSMLNTKHLMIKFSNLKDILDIYKLIDEQGVSKIISNYNTIVTNKLCICKKDLKIKFEEVKSLCSNYIEMYDYLFQKVLEDDSLNEYEKLVAMIKENKK